MEEVKKNKKKNKVASLLLALALILTCGVAGTIAQYQKSLGGTATATVAKFDVSAAGLGNPQSYKLSLFDNVLDESGNAEQHVKKDTSEPDKVKLIAPGTSGKIDISLKNNSEVDVDCNLAVTLTGGEISAYKLANGNTATGTPKKIPLKFALSTASTIGGVQGNEWVTIAQLSNQLQNNSFTDVNGNALTPGSTTPLYLYWKWEFNSGDNELDTAIGEIMQYKGRDANYGTTTNNIATVPSVQAAQTNSLTLPTTAVNEATFTFPEVTVTATFEQVN